MNTCWEKSLFIFWELDVLGVTGGNQKRHVGGVLTLYYFTFVIIIIGSFVVHYLFFNNRLDMQEQISNAKWSLTPSGWIFEFKFYVSALEESQTNVIDINNPNANHLIDTSANDLCYW